MDIELPDFDNHSQNTKLFFFIYFVRFSINFAYRRKNECRVKICIMYLKYVRILSRFGNNDRTDLNDSKNIWFVLTMHRTRYIYIYVSEKRRNKGQKMII